MKCKDCKGSGQYQGLGAPEPCQSCNGTGKETTPGYPAGTQKKDWDNLADRFTYEEIGDRYEFVYDLNHITIGSTINIVNGMNQVFPSRVTKVYRKKFVQVVHDGLLLEIPYYEISKTISTGWVWEWHKHHSSPYAVCTGRA